MADRKASPLWEGKIVRGALLDSLGKFDPRLQARNPVMFVVEVTALAVTLILARDAWLGRTSLAVFELQIAIWLWFTVGFGNFPRGVAEGRCTPPAQNVRRPAP